MKFALPNWTAAGLVGACAAAAVLCSWAPAEAIPVFAHRYGFTCRQCHSTVPQLNDFGERFRDNGFRLPGASTRGAFPVAVKVNLAYTSEPDPGGLPKALVDEIELLTGGSHGNFSYFVESYVVDGGRHGNVRDAWFRYSPSDDGAEGGLSPSLRAGQFTLPLPVDPESLRLTENHYAVFDQTIGENPFNLFDPRLGATFSLGHEEGVGLNVLALRGHDPQSGLPSRGVDTMLSAAAPIGQLKISAYRYAGARQLSNGIDAFWRFGYAISNETGKFSFIGLLQTGHDSDAGAETGEAASSGGFLEARWTFSPAVTAVARYDRTNDPSGTRRSTTISIVRRLTRNSKLTLEDVLSSSKHTFNAGLLFAY